MGSEVREIGVFAVSCALLITAIAFGMAEVMAETEPAASEGMRAQEANTTITEGAEADPDLRVLEERVRDIVEAYGEEKCARAGMVRYHGQCMTSEDRDILFETEIRHMESLLQQALSQYQTADPLTLALSFREVEEFVGRFGPREIMDERVTDKLILVLGYLYMPADRIVKDLKQDIERGKTSEDMFEFLERQERMTAFSEQVYVPLMELFGRKSDDYVARYGILSYRRLMRDNGLSDVLKALEAESRQ